MDTHTAIAWAASNKFIDDGVSASKNVVLSTASPYKFTGSVLAALGEEASGDDRADMEKLSEITGTEIPSPLSAIFEKEVKHRDIIDVDEMMDEVKKYASEGKE